MSIIESVKNTAFTAAVNMALNYLEKDPETNIPKTMNLIDKALPDGWYESQRAAFRKAIDEKGNWYELILKVYQLDTGVRKTLFQNFIINSALKGGAIQEEMRKKKNAMFHGQFCWTLHQPAICIVPAAGLPSTATS